jgi:succinate-acetate transporter protein
MNMQEKVRPLSVSIIAWILIVTAGLALITTTLMINNPKVQELMGKSPIPVPLQYAMTYVGLAATIIAAVGMLKGCNWGRLLYVIYGAFGSLIGLITSPMKAAMIPSIVIFLLFIFLLFRPKANQYFSKAHPDNEQSG